MVIRYPLFHLGLEGPPEYRCINAQIRSMRYQNRGFMTILQSCPYWICAGILNRYLERQLQIFLIFSLIKKWMVQKPVFLHVTQRSPFLHVCKYWAFNQNSSWYGCSFCSGLWCRELIMLILWRRVSYTEALGSAAVHEGRGLIEDCRMEFD